MDNDKIKEVAKQVVALIENKRLNDIAVDVYNKGKFLVATSPSVYNDSKKIEIRKIIDSRYLCLLSMCAELRRNKVEGCAAELGVYKGAFAKAIHALLPDKNLYLFDTFCSFDKKQFEEEKLKYETLLNNQKRFSNTTVESVLEYIGGNRDLLHPVIGMFPDSLKTVNIKNNKYCLVSLDADLYQPTKDGIEYFYPRMNPGGVIMIHDFVSKNYPGARDAVIEYVKKEHIAYSVFPDIASTCCIVKPF